MTDAAESRSVSRRLAAAPVRSYKNDPSVPLFDDSRALIVYDGVCVLCSRTMRAISRADTHGRIQFASAQSGLGQALFRHYRLDPEAFETVLLVHGGRCFGKLDAVTEVASIIGGSSRPVRALRILPRRMQDKIYDLVAENRYRLFGRTEACMLPDPEWQNRVIGQAQP